MNNSASDKLITQRFVTEFNCIGPDCPVNCCQNWSILLEKKAFLGIKKLYNNIPGSKRLTSSLKKDKKTKNDHEYGIIKLDKDGLCPFLNTDGLCDIHGRFGSEKLGFACRDFPRSVTENDDSTELSISLACPEAARLCLTMENATDFIEVGTDHIRDMSGQKSQLKTTEFSPNNVRWRNEIRQVMLSIIDADQYSIDERLYLMLYFSNDVSKSLGTKKDRISIEQELIGAIDNISAPLVHPELVKQFKSMPYDPGPFIVTVSSMIGFKKTRNLILEKYLSDNLTPVIAGFDMSKVDDPQINDIKSIFQIVSDRKTVFLKLNNPLDDYFYKVICHYLFQNSITNASSLLNYMRKMLILINVIYFLFYINDKLTAIVDGTITASDEVHNAIETALIEAVHMGQRSLTHQNSFTMKIIDDILDEHGFNQLDRLSMLAKSN